MSDQSTGVTETASSFPLLEKYLSKIAKQKSAHTVRSYRNSLNLFLNFFTIENEKNIELLSRDDLEDWQQSLLDNGLNPSSVNTHLRNIKVFVAWLFNGEHIGKNPMSRIGALKESKKVRAVISDDEFESMISVCDLQEKAMLYVMRYALLRREEMTDLRVSDFRDGNRLLVQGKGDKEREVPLNPFVAKVVNEYLQSRPDVQGEDYIFVSQRGKHRITAEAIRQRIKKIAMESGIDADRVEEISCHTFRRTGITSLVNANVNLLIVKDMAGHANVGTTERYAQSLNEGMKNAVNNQKVVGD